MNKIAKQIASHYPTVAIYETFSIIPLVFNSQNWFPF